MLNVAPQKERISDHLRAMAEQDDKSAASGKTGEQSTIGGDMVASFDWKPSTAGRYKVPPALKRYFAQ